MRNGMVAYALDTDSDNRSPFICLRLDGPPVMVDVGLIQKSNVHMNALEVFKVLCLDLRGLRPLDLLLGDQHGSPFLKSAKHLSYAQVPSQPFADRSST